MSDVLVIGCPEGHRFTVSEVVWAVSHRHVCPNCAASYPVHALKPEPDSGGGPNR